MHARIATRHTTHNNTMGEREVAECVEEMIRSVEPGEYPGVLVRERMRDDVDADAIECMNAELDTALAQCAALETEVATLTKQTLDAAGQPVAERIYREIPWMGFAAQPVKIVIRLNLYSATHTASGGGNYDHTAFRNDWDAMFDISASASPRDARRAIEDRLDARCSRLVYEKLEPWDSGDPSQFCVMVCWSSPA